MFMEIARTVSKRSTCLKQQVGAVLVKEGRVICIGYNGVLPGCDPKMGMDDAGNTHTVHAEANIISFCAKEGISTKGCTLYVTLSPCEKCAELVIQSGIVKVYYLNEYRDISGIALLERSNIKCQNFYALDL